MQTDYLKFIKSLEIMKKISPYVPLKFIKKILMIAAVSIGVINFIQWQLLYQPNVTGKYSKNNYNGYRNPGEKGMIYDDIEIVANGQTLKGWFMKQKNSQIAPTVVFFHENAGNLGSRLVYLKEYYERVKCNIVIVAYRGFDESTGTSHQYGIQKDALAITNHVFQNLAIDKTKVFAHGRSLGGAVASYAFHQNEDKYKGLIIENTFTQIKDVVANIHPVFKLLSPLILFNTWKTIDIIGKIKKPILFISSGKDQLIPYKLMQELFQKSVQKQEYHIPNGDHNSNWAINYSEYFNQIKSFQQKILQ